MNAARQVWARLLLGAIALFGGLLADLTGAERVTTLKSIEIQSPARLASFWQFHTQNGLFAGVLERDVENRNSTLTFTHVAKGQATVVRRIASEDTRIRAMDARVIGSDLVYVMEMNRGQPLKLARLDLARLLDPAQATVAFEDMGELKLSSAQQAMVQLPLSSLWNVADSLAPKAWLFSPRLAVASEQGPEVVANTADGQAMSFALKAPGSGSVRIANAAEPQAIHHHHVRYTAFGRAAEPYSPFWSLERYSGPAEQTASQLWVSEGEQAATELSKTLAIGAVTAFSLAAGPDGAPWIFALRHGSGGTRVVALTRQGAAWSVAGEWALDVPGERISIEYAAQAWHVVWAARKAAGWSLRYARVNA